MFVVIIVNPADEIRVQGNQSTWTELLPHLVCGYQFSFGVVDGKLSEPRVLVLKDVAAVVTLNFRGIRGIK